MWWICSKALAADGILKFAETFKFLTYICRWLFIGHGGFLCGLAIDCQDWLGWQSHQMISTRFGKAAARQRWKKQNLQHLWHFAAANFLLCYLKSKLARFAWKWANLVQFLRISVLHYQTFTNLTNNCPNLRRNLFGKSFSLSICGAQRTAEQIYCGRI